MLGGGGFVVSKTCSVSEPTPRSTRCLVHIRAMLAVLVAIHIGIFLIAVVAAVNVAKTVNYYQTYLSGPLSGPSIALAVSNGMVTIDAVKNISTLASSMAVAGAASVGFDPYGFQYPNATNATSYHVRRVMMETAADGTVQDAMANLLNAVASKVQDFDAKAPGKFLAWVMASDPGPYIRQLMATARYGMASFGTVLGALGSPVDATIVGPDISPAVRRV